MLRRLLFLFAPLLGLALAEPCQAAERRVGGVLVPAYAARQPLRHASFDWDDNLVVMSTRMFLRSKHGGPELALSTAEWAHAKYLVGKPGELQDHFLDPDKKTGSFRNMGDNASHNVFLHDLKRTLEGSNDWRGPSWRAFVEQTSTPAGARRTTVITAREHLGSTMYEGLRFLQAQGEIAHLPPLRNLYAVNRPGAVVGGRPLVGTTPERKLIVQRVLLDELQREAQANGRTLKWHFSDDDWENYAATRDGLAPDVKSGRWPDLRIKLHFTGLDHPLHQPQALTLLPSGL